ncbi:hypothetical protein MMC13_005644 [Lambiella insularis]|nr:hypothetical protein [Lambiella insularis]
MVGIPGRPDLQFDLFDSLGLPPNNEITSDSIQKAWRRVNLHLHPDKVAQNDPYIPPFPTLLQAQLAKDYLLVDDRSRPTTESAEDRIATALRHGRDCFRSTWDPSAAGGTPAALQPIPGFGIQDLGPVAPTVDGQAPFAPSRPPRPSWGTGAPPGFADIFAGFTFPRPICPDPPLPAGLDPRYDWWWSDGARFLNYSRKRPGPLPAVEPAGSSSVRGSAAHPALPAEPPAPQPPFHWQAPSAPPLPPSVPDSVSAVPSAAGPTPGTLPATLPFDDANVTWWRSSDGTLNYSRKRPSLTHNPAPSPASSVPPPVSTVSSAPGTLPTTLPFHDAKVTWRRSSDGTLNYSRKRPSPPQNPAPSPPPSAP